MKYNDGSQDDGYPPQADDNGGVAYSRREAMHWLEVHHRKVIIALIIVLLFVVVGGIVLACAFSVDTHNRLHNQAMDIETIKAKTNSFNTHSLYSPNSASQRNEYRINLCHSALYQSMRVRNGTSLVLTRAQTERLEQLGTLRPYVIQTRVNIRYNVEQQQASSSAAAVKSNNAGDRYVETRFELVTNYPVFSTIRLIESAVDIYRKTVRTTRTLTLCSDSPSSSVPGCRRYTRLDGLMLVNNTYSIPLDQPSSSSSSSPSRKNASGVATTTGSGDESDVQVSSDKAEINAMEEDIAHIRLYHLQFYNEYQKSASHGNTASAADDEDDAIYNGEYQVLSAQVTAC